jgi:hypothetical protein
MMYFPLVHEFMKLIEMLGRVVVFMFFKYGKKINPLIDSRNNVRKTRKNKKIERSTPSSQYFVHFEPVESLINSSTMDSPGE